MIGNKMRSLPEQASEALMIQPRRGHCVKIFTEGPVEWSGRRHTARSNKANDDSSVMSRSEVKKLLTTLSDLPKGRYRSP